MRTALAQLAAPGVRVLPRRTLTVGPVPRLPPPRAHQLARGRPISVSAAASAGEKLFTSFDVFKGKGALNIKPIAPTFEPTGADPERRGLTLKRGGGLMFEVAPVSGTRTYDWSKKVVFMASVLELGEMLAWNGESSLTFTHDPNMGGPSAGMVIKTLKLSSMKDGFFLNLSQRDSSGGETKDTNQLSVPISFGEWAVMRSLMEFSIPRLLAFDRALADGQTQA